VNLALLEYRGEMEDQEEMEPLDPKVQTLLLLKRHLEVTQDGMAPGKPCSGCNNHIYHAQ
jgi:hypothetical protein